MNQTFKQRSALVKAAERGLYREPEPNEGDYILAGIGLLGMVAIIIFQIVEKLA